jgi:isochorismate hydrolase
MTSTQNILVYKSLMIHFSNKCLPISQRNSLTDFKQKHHNITLFNLIHRTAAVCLSVCVLQNTAEQNTPQNACFQFFLL